MKHTFTFSLLILLLLAPDLQAQTVMGVEHHDDSAPLVSPGPPTSGEVFAAALAFMAPRILEPIPIPELSLWGLRGLTALDPSLTPEQGGGTVRLRQGEKVVFTRPAPPADDANAWGVLDGQMVRAAANLSPPVREAGQTGIVQSFFDELFNHLDPYSRYVPPDDAVGDRARRTGTAGIGVVLGGRRGAVVIHTIIPGGPAADADLRPGDRILKIGGDSMHRETPHGAAALLAGPDGSDITLTVRGRDGETGNVVVTRATTPPNTVFPEIRDNILALRITGFSRDTDDRLATELARGVGPGSRLRGIVLDLRGNRGGLLHQAADAISILLGHGLIATTAGRDPQAAHDFRANGPDMTNGLPVVVLVDGRSASAAEIMAAALADNGRAVVVGSSTLGKGLVQTIDSLPDGGELFVTWSRVLAPLGWPVQGLGVLPQVCTSLGEAALQRQLDELSRGIQEMAAPLTRERDARAPVPAAQILEIRAPCPAAESRSSDMAAARYLIEHPAAYSAALMPAMQTASAPR